jgi:HAD superfamily 5'-nucleotidase-like hydrolase
MSGINKESGEFDSRGPLEEALLRLDQAGEKTEIDRASQVYVNRDLRMSSVQWVGFDMDYTLALYHQDALDALSLKHAIDTLIEDMGYPHSIRDIKPDPNFAIRGLVIDKLKGNILKMDSHHYVGRVFHGLKAAAPEIRRVYQNERVRIELDRYVLVDTLFSLPETFLYAALIEHIEVENGKDDLDYLTLYNDVRKSIDKAHGDGRIKQDILTDMSRYVYRDSSLADTLHNFRSAGKKLFLLTNSEWYYSDAIMAFLLDDALSFYPSWTQYFDVIITSARKPRFFGQTTPFKRLDPEGKPLDETVERFVRGAVYEGGNAEEFERMVSGSGENVLYIGDHIYGDIVRSKRDSSWRTTMIIQEMGVELEKQHLMVDENRRWTELDNRLIAINSRMVNQKHVLNRLKKVIGEYKDGKSAESALSGPVDREDLLEVQKALNSSIEKQLDERRKVLTELIELDYEVSENFNPYWGLLFKEGSENSIFGSQVESYACLYTAKVGNFLRYSPLQYFRANRQLMPHEI